MEKNLILKLNDNEATLGPEELSWKSDNIEFAGALDKITGNFRYSPSMGDWTHALAHFIAKEMPGIRIISIPEPEEPEEGKIY